MARFVAVVKCWTTLIIRKSSKCQSTELLLYTYTKIQKISKLILCFEVTKSSTEQATRPAILLLEILTTLEQWTSIGSIHSTSPVINLTQVATKSARASQNKLLEWPGRVVHSVALWLHHLLCVCLELQWVFNTEYAWSHKDGAETELQIQGRTESDIDLQGLGKKHNIDLEGTSIAAIQLSINL